jgi:tRNA-specific 2-thiouridylase
MNKSRKKQTVFVGVSGGVDSSVSAYLLKKADYNVVGVFIRTWQPDFIECTWRDERRDAMRVCAHLDIPFLECDGEAAYKKGVADYMIEEYRQGRTPNPDVMCNREVKFGVFWQFAKDYGADYIATGHYARVSKKETANSKQSVLEMGVDTTKDQSYFLWTLTEKDLEHTLFPIGHLKKTEVRKIAAKIKLPTAAKKDSQGVCFLGPLNMKEFIEHYIPKKTGNVLDTKGNIIGTHDGVVFYTLGERHGFTITKKSAIDKAYYVVAKNMKANTITVSASTNNISNTGILQNNSIELIGVNWIHGLPKDGKEYTAQIRYHGEQVSCTVTSIKASNVTVFFTKEILVSPGQSIVIYNKDVCVGGGIVK